MVRHTLELIKATGLLVAMLIASLVASPVIDRVNHRYVSDRGILTHHLI